MISKEAILEYLYKEPKGSYSSFKTATKEYYEESLPLSELKTKPYHHQMVGLFIGLLEDKFLYFYDMGTGKSKIVLDVLTIRSKVPDEWNRVLVVSPNASTVDTFVKEVEKHSNFDCIPLLGTREERWELLEKMTDINVINYTGLLTLCTDPKNGSWIPNKGKIEKLSKMFDVLILDEIHLAKNHRSLTFNVLRQLGKDMRLKYGLTGTPINRDPMALWAQFNLIDDGETLGKHISLFREAYFTMTNNFWGGVDFKFKQILEGNLNKKLNQKSIRYAEWEANDLPEKVVIDVPIHLSFEASEWYNSVINGIIYTEGDVDLIKESFHKLRRLCSGYFMFKNAEGIERELIPKENAKLETLLELIENTPEESKIVVFLDYVKSGDIICDALKKRKIKFERLYGGTKDKIGTKNRFIDDPKIKVLVTNTKSGGVGLNLQVANYAVFYELPLSNIDYLQAVKRVHRTGQSKRTFIYHLITKNSLEEKLMGYIINGQDLFKALIEGKEKLNGI